MKKGACPPSLGRGWAPSSAALVAKIKIVKMSKTKVSLLNGEEGIRAKEIINI